MNIRRSVSAAASALFVAAFLFMASSPAIGQGQGRYANRYSKRDVGNIIANLETSSNTFSTDFNRAMDRSNINGSSAEDRYNNIVRDFENSVDRLRRNFDSNDSWWQSRNEVQNMLSNARPVNTMMNSISFRRNIERQWSSLRNNINTVADTFDLPGLNGGGWNGGNTGGNWNGGNTGGNVPSWAVGTFYGRNPQTGGTIVLVINRNGSVSAGVEGSPSYGTLNGTNLNMSGNTARVSQINNGIRTRGSDGEVIDYYRANGAGNGNDGNFGGNVPNWAIGTFYARNPQTGGRITMTIQQNGQVYVDLGNNGGTAYGTVYGTTLTVNNATATISRRGNGIRTVRTDNGERIDYTR